MLVGAGRFWWLATNDDATEADEEAEPLRTRGDPDEAVDTADGDGALGRF